MAISAATVAEHFPPTTTTTVNFHPIILNHTLHPIPAELLASFRELINPSFAVVEGSLFKILRFEEQEFLTPDRYIVALFSSSSSSSSSSLSPSSPQGKLELVDHQSVTHDVGGWKLVGTVSLDVEMTPGRRRRRRQPYYELHLLAVDHTQPSKSGLGARVLSVCEEFVVRRGGGVLAAAVIVESGKVGYYKRRGFEEVGGRMLQQVGVWGSVEEFSLQKMEKVVGEAEEEETEGEVEEEETEEEAEVVMVVVVEGKGGVRVW
jgi:predicted N-acetyltransferase YhbS